MILDLQALLVNLKKEDKMIQVETRDRENILIPQGPNVVNATIMEVVEGGNSRITGINIDGLFIPKRIVDALRWIPGDKL